ncbi:MAG: NAD-dependent DNA ligase LigA [Lachnospiraceae bacterium]|nr:NAD-dependent DNA ligase LigA [Lachnospiraceae bacterium]
MNDIARMKELISLLNEASRAYYQESREIMPNERYDRLYDELCALEEKTGTVLANSPTQKVGYEVVSALPREAHEQAALSLDKTKDVEALQAFLGSQTGVLSWKLDGLTVVLTYDGGTLTKAVTRGNGEVGEVVTQNAKTFVNLPLKIPYEGHLVLRGEAVIRYPDFERLNAETDEDAKYKNPRNLCAGSVRQLDPAVTAKRSVNLIAFALIEADGLDFGNSMNEQLNCLDRLGFETVQRRLVNADTLPEAVKEYAEAVQTYDVPSDGLVLVMDDLAYGTSLGRTAKFPRNAMAFKWQDEMADTVLREVEWSASRTGLINPVAIFDPVELEGTTVSRASVHNVSVAQELKLGIGDTVRVYKANMIIPQIAQNLTQSGNLPIPDVCPVCGGKTVIRDEAGVKTLFCVNPECPAKQVKSFELFASRNALKMDGLSEMTMEKLIDRGFIRTFADLFRLSRHEEDIVSMEGFGRKSFENMQKTVEGARRTTLSRLLYGLGIPGIGVAGGKLLANHFGGDLEALRKAPEEELTAIDGIGDVTARDIVAYFKDERKASALDDLLTEIVLEQEEAKAGDSLAGKTFVVTGAVHLFPNRDALKDYIEARGGKVASAVSAKTDYLINNDVNSSSGKNKKAKELNVPVISEEDFMKLAEG